MRSPWQRSPLPSPSPPESLGISEQNTSGSPADSRFLEIPSVSIQPADEERSPRLAGLIPSSILTTPRMLTFLRLHPNSGTPSPRSPNSVHSSIISSATPETSAFPLSPIIFERPRASLLRAPARVLDYGGNVLLESPDQTLRRAHPLQNEGEPARQPSQLQQRRWRTQGRGPRWIPRHSSGKVFFPAMKHPAIKNKVLHCIISGVLLLLVFIVFMALMNSTSVFSQEFRIITILFILVFIVLFTHSLIRLLMLLLRLKKRGSLERGDPRTSGFAQVSRPIRVVLARDEELGLGGTEGRDEIKDPPPPPPVYGHWRGSVRVDPNLIHWQRVERSNPRPLSEETVRRPPSYISEGQEEEEEREERSRHHPNHIESANENINSSEIVHREDL